MPDFTLGKWIRPPLEGAAARMSALGFGPLILITAGFAAGLAALPALATGHFWFGLASILSSRAMATVGHARAGVRERGLAGAFELIFLASVPFAFALNDPNAALSTTLLLFALIAAGAASLFADDARALARSDVTVCVAAFALACLRPNWFALVAYMLSLFCFIAAGMRIALVFTRGDT